MSKRKRKRKKKGLQISTDGHFGGISRVSERTSRACKRIMSKLGKIA